MGGVMIKVGQFLSARLDVLPREITDELAGLQDEVKPEKVEEIRFVLENEFSLPVTEIFPWFDPIPLAAASIGQVHRARLRSVTEGIEQEVVVKVQRPHIEAIVAVDLQALRIVSRWIDLYPPIRRRIDTPALMEEFSKTLGEEIDYLLEGRHAEMFAANFASRPDVRVPRVFWSHTTRRVLCLEYIQAIKVTDYPAVESAGLDRAEVAERLFGTYLKQIFEDRFFHADPHPGNLFILPAEDPGQWTLVFVDFGMTGSLDEKLISGLREALIAIGTQDSNRLVRAYQQLDILLPGADTETIQKASAEAFSRFWGRTAPELASIGREEILQFAQEFGDILYEMPFQIPENFILLGRCVGILSGICSGLDPEFNIWQQIVPYARSLVEDQRSGGARWLLSEVGDTLRIAVSLPRRTDELINRLEQGKLAVQTPDLQRRLERLDRTLRRLVAAVVFAACLMAAVQLLLAGHSPFGMAAGAAALLSFLYLLMIR